MNHVIAVMIDLICSGTRPAVDRPALYERWLFCRHAHMVHNTARLDT